VSFLDALNAELEAKVVAGSTSKSLKESLDPAELGEEEVVGKSVQIRMAESEKVRYHKSVN
jgi:hypothetical protein